MSKRTPDDAKADADGDADTRRRAREAERRRSKAHVGADAAESAFPEGPELPELEAARLASVRDESPAPPAPEGAVNDADSSSVHDIDLMPLPRTPPEGPPTAGADALLAGTQVGPYRIERRLGAGGMAEVYLGGRQGAVGFTRQVAIKRVRTALNTDAKYRKMFLDEARLAARLTHRNMAQVHDVVEEAGGLFLVMEYIEGASLRELLALCQLKARSLSEAFACYVAVELCDALQYAHSAKDASGRVLGVVHRDVTPHNVMLSTSGEVKLLDFGIAYSNLEGREETESGLLKGKFVYMSPEQATGEEVLDGRSDLFSLALIVVELCTGRRVFETPSESKTLLRVCEANPKDVDAAVQALPRALQDILKKALQKGRDARYGTGSELGKALRGYMAAAGHVFGPSDAALEVERLKEAPKNAGGTHAESPHAKALAAGEPVSISLSELGVTGESKSASASSAERRSAQVRELVRNPQSPKRKVAVPLLALAGVVLIGNALAWVLIRANAPKGPAAAEVVTTPEQHRAEVEAEAKKLEPEHRPPELAQVPLRPEVHPAETLASPPGATAAAPVAKKKHPARVQAPPAAAEPPPVVHHRSLDSSTVTTFADAPPSTSGATGVPRGTLLPAKLTTPADPSAPGPVSAVVSEDVRVGGTVAVPKGATLVCASQGASKARVAVTCDGLNLPGRGAVAFEGTALGADKRPGLPVKKSGGGSNGGKDAAKDGAITTAARVGEALAPDGVSGALIQGAVDTATEGARRESAAEPEALSPAPSGTTLYVFVNKAF
jgi:serine/threonine protein kinase